MGNLDFTSFCKVNSSAQHNRCSIYSAQWIHIGKSLIFEISANRFLYGMVRALVGTMVNVGRGYTNIDEFKSIIEASSATGIHYTAIFEACIGKIFKAKNVIWEFKKGNHYIKYKAFYINAATNYKRKVGFNG